MGTLYKEFMSEYELLGYMEEIKNEALDKINYYIPHHSVYKPEKASTPLRIVFDASAKTTSGFSLNSILLNGGIIQQDLFSIVSSFENTSTRLVHETETGCGQGFVLISNFLKSSSASVWFISNESNLSI
ncbi:integrase catalytic domain-containing protein [Trichonephila clavipes]|nr:integrase catalytic domain-containing protein [Trichonephila clavipes]